MNQRWGNGKQKIVDMMKISIPTCVIILTCACAFGQEKPKTVYYYENKVKAGPFFMRWYWTIRGGSPYVWKETLQLRSDSTFIYSYQGEDCGTFDHSGWGTWTRKGKELILNPNENCYMLQNLYIIEKRKLYASQSSLESRTTAFKKR